MVNAAGNVQNKMVATTFLYPSYFKLAAYIPKYAKLTDQSNSDKRYCFFFHFCLNILFNLSHCSSYSSGNSWEADVIVCCNLIEMSPFHQEPKEQVQVFLSGIDVENNLYFMGV